MREYQYFYLDKRQKKNNFHRICLVEWRGGGLYGPIQGHK